MLRCCRFVCILYMQKYRYHFAVTLVNRHVPHKRHLCSGLTNSSHLTSMCLCRVRGELASIYYS